MSANQSFFGKHYLKLIAGAASIGLGYLAFKILTTEKIDLGVPLEVYNDDRKDLLLRVYGN